MSAKRKRPAPLFVLFPHEPAPTVETAREALERGDLAGAYRIFKVLMDDAGLPIDWFSPYRRGGDSLH